MKNWIFLNKITFMEWETIILHLCLDQRSIFHSQKIKMSQT
jgi:hypothetical protein